MDLHGQIQGKRESAARVRQLAMALSGDSRIGALCYAAKLEAQAAALENFAARTLLVLSNRCQLHELRAQDFAAAQ